MLKKLLTPLLLLAATHTAAAQSWSVGVHTGPFVFGDFVKRTLRLGNETTSDRSTDILSADTRAGVAFDVEHTFADRWGIRLEATANRSPLSVKGSTSDDGFEIDAGDMDVATVMLPIVFRINPKGSLRFHLLGGPAYAAYRARGGTASFPLFDETRAQWGAAFGGGAAWHWSKRVSVEGNLTDIVTSSPFRETDFPTRQGLEIPKTHNVHTTVGLRIRF